MDSFNKRSADIFGALDKLEPQKSKETEKSTSDGEFKRPHGVYTPPSKRSKTSASDHSTSHSLATSRSEHEPIHRDQYRHTRHHHHGSSCDSRRRGHAHPDKDPSKWTKYDLKDDGTRQLSGLSDEQINRQVAYQFLDQLKQWDKPREEELASLDKKIVFKKPTRLCGEAASDAKMSTDSSTVVEQPTKKLSGRSGENSTDTDTLVDKSIQRESECHSATGGVVSGGVTVMPEYVVGVTSHGRRKRSLRKLTTEETGSDDLRKHDLKVEGRGAARAKQSSVVLSHLEDSEDY